MVLGDQYTLEKIVTRYDVMSFSMLTGDYNYVHVDGGVVHGFLISAYVSRLIGMKLPGVGTMIASISLDFKHPAYINDTLRITGTVSKISPVVQAAIIHISILNQNDLELTNGEVVVKYP